MWPTLPSGTQICVTFIMTISVPDSVSDFMNFLDYEAPVMPKVQSHNSVPETDWRLITALAKKREIDEERERMADAFQRMWIKEKEQNKEVSSGLSLSD